MITGTEGPDVLSNDPSLSSDTIYALGGDDTINVTMPSGPNGTIVVDGGQGVDTLTIRATYLAGLFTNLIWMSGGPMTTTYAVEYSSIERLVVHAGAYAPITRSQIYEAHWFTGDTLDEIHVLSSFAGLTPVRVSTGGGDDRIYFGNVAGGSVLAGPGDDLVDFSAAQSSRAIDWSYTYSAIGEEGNDLLIGSSLGDALYGGGGNDELRSGPGYDRLDGGPGDDLLYFGPSFNADSAHGGEGRDALVLQGDYIVGLDGYAVSGIESISLQSGANTQFGDTANNFYDYRITIYEHHAYNLLTAGQELIVNGQSLRAGEDFTFDASTEIEGRFLVFGGYGIDTLTGGAGNDIFVFDGGRWGAGDSVHGGSGRDAVVITAGNGLTRVEFGAASLTGVESVTVANRYASDPGATPSYEFVLRDGNVAPGGTLIVNGSSILLGQVVNVDGRGVHDGNLILFGGGGHDVITGGGGTDLLFGGGGQDSLAGGLGADSFRYDSVSDTPAAAPDLIGDFQAGLDKIDLSRIDANTALEGNQAFSWIGSNAFSGSGVAAAGELRVYGDGGYQRIEADTDGDGLADLAIVLQLGTAPLGQGDFLV